MHNLAALLLSLYLHHVADAVANQVLRTHLMTLLLLSFTPRPKSS